MVPFKIVTVVTVGGVISTEVGFLKKDYPYFKTLCTVERVLAN